MSIKILVTDGMNKESVEELKNHGFEVIEKFYEPDELAQKVQDVDAIVIRSATKINKKIIDGARETNKLKLIIRAGVGIDNIDAEYAKEFGITVTNTPNSSSSSVAELAIGHMFSIARHIHIANVTMRQNQWNKKKYEGIELSGKTLGLIGFGRIAKETAKRALALGMKVVYYEMLGKQQGFEQCESLSFDEVLAKSDFISLHIPYFKEKGATIRKEQFDKMKDGVYLINCARGGVVCEKSLLEAVNSGKVAGAALDVFEEEPVKNFELYNHDRISLTPHIGASTVEAQERIGQEIVSIISEFFKA